MDGMEGSIGPFLDVFEGEPLEKTRGSGPESWSLRTRGGVGEKASKASSSESRISSMSMKRFDAAGGVEGGCAIHSFVCDGDAGGFRKGIDEALTVGMADGDFGG